MSNSLSAPDLGFAQGGHLVAECLRALLPPDPVGVADFAAAYRWMSNEGGGYVGRWSHAHAPFLIAPMEELAEIDKLTVAVVGPGQVGKTEIGRNWLFASAMEDPADMLWYSSSETVVVSEVKTSISRMISDHPSLAARLSESSLSFKRFGSMSVQFLAGIMNNFISKSAPRLVVDEFDAICRAVPNAKPLLDVRRQTFGARSKLLALSHPDLAEGLEPEDWNAGIMELYRDSDRRIWYWQCPACGAFSSPNPTGERVMSIHCDENAPDDEIASMARLLCPVNGCLIEDSQRREMNLTGKWVGLGQHIDQDGIITGARVARDTAGFWIVGAMSPFLLDGIGGLALARVRAERKFAIDGDRKSYAEVMSKQWGVPLARDRKTDSIDADVIADRADAALTLGKLVNGVRFITVMIDVQGNRFELLARGWLEHGASVVVDFRRIEASPGTSATDWDDVLEFATNYAWPLADDPARGMRAVMVGFDTGGAPGVTVQAYDAWRRLRAAKTVKMLGRIDGRPAWNVLPLKGASTLQAPRLNVVLPNAARTDRFAQARGEVPLGVFNPNLFKDDLQGHLAQAEGDAWSIRFPAALRSAAKPHVWFEQLVAEDRAANGRWTKRQAGQPNEAMDLMVGSHVLAFLLGVQRIKWDLPPSWARNFADNPNVIDLIEAKQSSAIAGNPARPPVQISSAPAATGSKIGIASKSNIRVIDSVPMRGR